MKFVRSPLLIFSLFLILCPGFVFGSEKDNAEPRHASESLGAPNETSDQEEIPPWLLDVAQDFSERKKNLPEALSVLQTKSQDLSSLIRDCSRYQKNAPTEEQKNTLSELCEAIAHRLETKEPEIAAPSGQSSTSAQPSDENKSAQKAGPTKSEKAKDPAQSQSTSKPAAQPAHAQEISDLLQKTKPQTLQEVQAAVVQLLESPHSWSASQKEAVNYLRSNQRSQPIEIAGGFVILPAKQKSEGEPTSFEVMNKADYQKEVEAVYKKLGSEDRLDLSKLNERELLLSGLTRLSMETQPSAWIAGKILVPEGDKKFRVVEPDDFAVENKEAISLAASRGIKMSGPEFRGFEGLDQKALTQLTKELKDSRSDLGISLDSIYLGLREQVTQRANRELMNQELGEQEKQTPPVTYPNLGNIPEPTEGSPQREIFDALKKAKAAFDKAKKADLYQRDLLRNKTDKITPEHEEYQRALTEWITKSADLAARGIDPGLYAPEAIRKSLSSLARYAQTGLSIDKKNQSAQSDFTEGLALYLNHLNESVRLVPIKVRKRAGSGEEPSAIGYFPKGPPEGAFPYRLLETQASNASKAHKAIYHGINGKKDSWDTNSFSPLEVLETRQQILRNFKTSTTGLLELAEEVYNPQNRLGRNAWGANQYFYPAESQKQQQAVQDAAFGLLRQVRSVDQLAKNDPRFSDLATRLGEVAQKLQEVPERPTKLANEYFRDAVKTSIASIATVASLGVTSYLFGAAQVTRLATARELATAAVSGGTVSTGLHVLDANLRFYIDKDQDARTTGSGIAQAFGTGAGLGLVSRLAPGVGDAVGAYFSYQSSYAATDAALNGKPGAAVGEAISAVVVPAFMKSLSSSGGARTLDSPLSPRTQSLARNTNATPVDLKRAESFAPGELAGTKAKAVLADPNVKSALQDAHAISISPEGITYSEKAGKIEVAREALGKRLAQEGLSPKDANRLASQWTKEMIHRGVLGDAPVKESESPLAQIEGQNIYQIEQRMGGAKTRAEAERKLGALANDPYAQEQLNLRFGEAGPSLQQLKEKLSDLVQKKRTTERSLSSAEREALAAEIQSVSDRINVSNYASRKAEISPALQKAETEHQRLVAEGRSQRATQESWERLKTLREKSVPTMDEAFSLVRDRFGLTPTKLDAPIKMANDKFSQVHNPTGNKRPGLFEFLAPEQKAGESKYYFSYDTGNGDGSGSHRGTVWKAFQKVGNKFEYVGMADEGGKLIRSPSGEALAKPVQAFAEAKRSSEKSTPREVAPDTQLQPGETTKLSRTKQGELEELQPQLQREFGRQVHDLREAFKMSGQKVPDWLRDPNVSGKMVEVFNNIAGKRGEVPPLDEVGVILQREQELRGLMSSHGWTLRQAYDALDRAAATWTAYNGRNQIPSEDGGRGTQLHKIPGMVQAAMDRAGIKLRELSWDQQRAQTEKVLQDIFPGEKGKAHLESPFLVQNQKSEWIPSGRTVGQVLAESYAATYGGPPSISHTARYRAIAVDSTNLIQTDGAFNNRGIERALAEQAQQIFVHTVQDPQEGAKFIQENAKKRGTTNIPLIMKFPPGIEIDPLVGHGVAKTRVNDAWGAGAAANDSVVRFPKNYKVGTVKAVRNAEGKIAFIEVSIDLIMQSP